MFRFVERLGARVIGGAAGFIPAVFALFAFSAAAEAQFLTFVSATGNDTQPCTVEAQPCKTVQRGISALSAGGTLRILTDLPQQQAATIAKSMTVEGGGHTMIGRLVINSASAVVALRGLNLTGRGAHAVGISITSAAAVHIEDCTAERYTNSGISLAGTTATKLFVSDTVSRDNGYAGLYVGDANAQVAVADSRFEGNFNSGLYLESANANVTRSIASGGTYGIVMVGGTTNLTETTAADNSQVGFLVSSGAAPP